MAENANMTQYEVAHRKRTFLSSALIFIAIPLTMWFGTVVLNQNKYMIISLLIIIYTMLPFFMVFEKRKPKAREIVLIAMMCVLTVCAQIFFHVVLPVPVGTAIVIISGISLGPEAGFLIGALSRFVCNFYMGQGPWTPWQMFCWGILGFLAGLAFNKVEIDKMKTRSLKVVVGPVMCTIFAGIAAYVSFLIWPGDDNSFFGWRLYAFGVAGLIIGSLLQRKRLSVDGITLAVFSFFVTFIVYGGLMNLCAMVTSSGTPGGNPISFSTLRMLYASGVPYDLMHAITAAVCTFFFGDAIIKKLERIKIKYGIYK